MDKKIKALVDRANKDLNSNSCRNTIPFSRWMEEQLILHIEILKRYEKWEANIVLEPKCWENEYPELTEELYEELMEIQELRNKALGFLK